jgi:hypothetical protein
MVEKVRSFADRIDRFVSIGVDSRLVVEGWGDNHLIAFSSRIIEIRSIDPVELPDIVFAKTQFF